MTMNNWIHNAADVSPRAGGSVARTPAHRPSREKYSRAEIMASAEMGGGGGRKVEDVIGLSSLPGG